MYWMYFPERDRMTSSEKTILAIICILSILELIMGGLGFLEEYYHVVVVILLIFGILCAVKKIHIYRRKKKGKEGKRCNHRCKHS